MARDVSFGEALEDAAADARRRAVAEDAECESGAMSDEELYKRWKEYRDGGGMAYIPSRTIELLMASDKQIRGVMGPVGSGKTTGALADIAYRTGRQNPCADGVIRNRAAFIRGKIHELRETVIDVWMFMFPKTEMKISPPIRGKYTYMLNDSKAELEILGYGMDKSGAEAALRSNFYSIALMSEAQYLAFETFKNIVERLGRYPHMKMAPVDWRKRPGMWVDGQGKERWFKNLGLNMETNAPVEGSWWWQKSEVDLEPEYEVFFKQPPAMFRTWNPHLEKWVYEENRGQRPGIPKAENIENLLEGWEYYWRLVRLNGDDYAQRNVLNEYTARTEGRPVFPEFSTRFHVPASGVPWPEDINRVVGRRIYGGMDFGRTPRVVLAYVNERGRLNVFAEVAKDCGVRLFAQTALLPLLLTKKIPPSRLRLFCDPSGMNHGDQSEIANIMLLREMGIDAVAPNLVNNSEPARIEAVRQCLTSIVGETGGIVFDPSCVGSIRALGGGYCYTRYKVGGQYHDGDKPNKRSPHSHIADAIQYLCSGLRYGASEISEVLGGVGSGGYGSMPGYSMDGGVYMPTQFDEGVLC